MVNRVGFEVQGADVLSKNTIALSIFITACQTNSAEISSDTSAFSFREESMPNAPVACAALTLLNEGNASELQATSGASNDKVQSWIDQRPFSSIGAFMVSGLVDESGFDTLTGNALESGYACEHICSQAIYRPVTEAILQALDDGDTDALEQAMSTGCVNAYDILGDTIDEVDSDSRIDSLLDAGLDLNAPADSLGQTPLQEASRRGSSDKDLIKVLVNIGADPNRKWVTWGMSSLHLLMYYGSYGHYTMPYLLEAGAEIDGVTDVWRHTPLMLCVRQFSGQCQWSHLLDAGADPYAISSTNQTVFTFASRERRLRGELLELGLNTSGPEGEPLWAYELVESASWSGAAVMEGHVPILEEMLTHPDLVVDLTAPGVEKALEYAPKKEGAQRFVDYIIDRGDGDVDYGEPILETERDVWGLRDGRFLRNGLDITDDSPVYSLENKSPFVYDGRVYFFVDTPSLPSGKLPQNPESHLYTVAYSTTGKKWCNSRQSVNIHNANSVEIDDQGYFRVNYPTPTGNKEFMLNLKYTCY